MALGCAFIFVVLMMLWRRRARQHRAKQTAMFASARQLNHDKSSWRWRFMRFGERFFGHSPSRRVGGGVETEEMKLLKLRAAEEARYERDMDKILDAYDYSREEEGTGIRHHSKGLRGDQKQNLNASRPVSHNLSTNSIFSEVTGKPRRGPNVRQPVKDEIITSSSRVSASTSGSYMFKSRPVRETDGAVPRPAPSEAQTYAAANRPVLPPSPPPVQGQGSYWMKLEPVKTGSSKNPFRI